MARRVPPKLPRRATCSSKTPPPPTGPGPKPQFNSDRLAQLSSLMSKQFGWDAPPREFQLEGTVAQLLNQDALIHAPTGSGKTAIAAGPHVMQENLGRVTLMVSPLIALQNEMVETFQQEYHLSGTAVNSAQGGCSPAHLQDIISGKYQIVLISPEMLLSRRFINVVLRDTRFTRHVISVVVDEAHVVSQWGADFRKKYGTLGIVRAFLPRTTPIIAMSGTLTARVSYDVRQKLQFPRSGYKQINLSNDRPNVSIVVRACHHNFNTYADLDFLIPPETRAEGSHPLRILKGMVYADNTSVGSEITDHLDSLLAPHLQRKGIIRPFNATMPHAYRKKAMEEFKAGRIRILVCTDAAGMGCNIPDIDIVVQWKLPATLSNLIQRIGRVARGKNRTGVGVLLVEPTAYSLDPALTSATHPLAEDAPTTPAPARGTPRGRVRARGAGRGRGRGRGRGKSMGTAWATARGRQRGHRRQTDHLPQSMQPALVREASDEGLLVLVQTTLCRRQVLTEVFDNPRPIPSVPCCDLCNPSLLQQTLPGLLPPVSKTPSTKLGVPSPPVIQALRDWRDSVWHRDHSFALYDSSIILPADMITTLASSGPLIQSRHQLRCLLEPQWGWWSRYADELYSTLAGLAIAPLEPLPAKTRKRKATESAPAGPPLSLPSTPLDTLFQSSKRARPDILPPTPSPAAIPGPSRTPNHWTTHTPHGITPASSQGSSAPQPRHGTHPSDPRTPLPLRPLAYPHYPVYQYQYYTAMAPPPTIPSTPYAWFTHSTPGHPHPQPPYPMPLFVHPTQPQLQTPATPLSQPNPTQQPNPTSSSSGPSHGTPPESEFQHDVEAGEAR